MKIQEQKFGVEIELKNIRRIMEIPAFSENLPLCFPPSGENLVKSTTSVRASQCYEPGAGSML